MFYTWILLTNTLVALLGVLAILHRICCGDSGLDHLLLDCHPYVHLQLLQILMEADYNESAESQGKVDPHAPEYVQRRRESDGAVGQV